MGRLDSRIRAAIEEHGFGILVIDPWATFFTGNENANDEVEAGLDQLRRLAQETRVAVVILHHLGKSQEGVTPRTCGGERHAWPTGPRPGSP